MDDFESIYDAMKGAVGALGGYKKVGPMLRPTYHDAAQWLRNCCNPEHPLKIDPDQMMYLFGLACDAGYHDAKHYFDRGTKYQSTPPIAVESQLAEELARIQARRRRDDEDERDLRNLIDNPKLLALAKHLNLKVDA